jgi:site-specific recombinase XerD
MQEIIKKFNKELRFKSYSLRTISSYTSCVSLFWKYLLGRNKFLSNITRDLILDFILSLQEKNKAPKTINLYKEAIMSFWRLVLHKEFQRISLSKVPRKLPIVLSREEIKKIINNISNSKHKLMIQVAYSSWLRVSEVVKLKIKDIDFLQNTIHVKNAKWMKERITVLSTKIKTKLMVQCEFKHKNSYVFPSLRWWNLTTRSLQNIFIKSLKKTRIKKEATFHSLRHSFATHLLENWTDIRYVQELLWHSNIRTTQIYTQVTNPAIKNILSPL